MPNGNSIRRWGRTSFGLPSGEPRLFHCGRACACSIWAAGKRRVLFFSQENSASWSGPPIYGSNRRTTCNGSKRPTWPSGSCPSKPGGHLCMVAPGLNEELLDGPPEALRPYWEWEFCSFHTPGWWRRHWSKTGLVEIERADALADGWNLVGRMGRMLRGSRRRPRWWLHRGERGRDAALGSGPNPDLRMHGRATTNRLGEEMQWARPQRPCPHSTWRRRA
jgi:hypothetical protein